jgi:hypothetical protein
LTRHAERRAKAFEGRDRSLTTLAKGKVLAGNHAGRAGLPDEPVTDKFLSRNICQRFVEPQHQHRVGTGSGKQQLALIERRQPKRRNLGSEIMNRMRVKGRDNGGATFGTRNIDGSTDHGLMAEVESIEIAKRNDTAA